MKKIRAGKIFMSSLGCLACLSITLSNSGWAADTNSIDPRSAIKKAHSTIENASEALNGVESHLAEWGHASISGFVLVPDRSGYFDLGYSNSMSNYIATVANQTQGQAAFLDQSQFSANLEAQGANAVPGLNVRSPVVTTTNSPAGPTNPTPALPALASNTVPQLITNGFSPLGKLATQESGNQLSPDTILKLAATAKIEERVLGFMGHPVDVPDNKQVFFAVGQISVMPGWRSKQDYICEVSAHFNYAGLHSEISNRVLKLDTQFDSITNFTGEKSVFLKAHDSILELTNHPNANSANYRLYFANTERAKRDFGEFGTASPISVVAAFPFMESQVFDLQSSYRNQLNLLMNLAASYVQAGYSIDAKLLINYVKQVQKDLSTRTAFPTVIPGDSEGTITYRFDPEATAMSDPTQTEPKAGNLLLPTSIPVLILVECDKNDLRCWPQMSVDVETRWLPRVKHSILSKAGSFFAHQSWPKDSMPPGEGLHVAELLETAALSLRDLEAIEQTTTNHYYFGPIYSELYRKLDALQQADLGRSTALHLPAFSPVANSLSPTNCDSNYTNNLVITGENLDYCFKAQLSSPAFSIPLNITNYGGSVALANSTDALKPGTYDLLLEGDDGSSILPHAITVTKSTNSASANPKPSCENRPPMAFTSISPTHGFINDRTTFVVIGTNFDPGQIVVGGKTNVFNDKITSVFVGGRAATNLLVLNNTALRFDLPAWVNTGTNASFAAPTNSDAYDLSLVSGCTALVTNAMVYFDRLSPQPLSQTGGGFFDEQVDSQAKALKALLSAQGDTNSPPRLTGTIRLEVGNSPKTATNSAANGSSSTVIIQNGQNGATSH